MSSTVTAKELLNKLQTSRAPAPTAASAPAQPDTANVASRRRLSLRIDHGYTNFTSGITAGWHMELRSRKFRQAVLAEVVASFLFVAFGTCAVIYSNGGDSSPNGLVNLLVIASVFGGLISALVYALGDVSGANINAAVSISLWISRKISLLRCSFYVLAQLVGATLGSAFVRGMNSTLFDNYRGASNAVNWSRPGTTYWTALSGEALCTSLLILVVHAAADVGRENHTKFVGAMTPIAIGLAVFLSHLILIPVTGCSINPSRSFGSAVVSGNWDAHWVFWVGPIGGGIISCIVYEFIFKTPLTPPSAPGGAGQDYRSVITPSISRENSSADLSNLANVDAAIAAHMASEAAFLPKAAALGASEGFPTRSVYLSSTGAVSHMSVPATAGGPAGLTYRGSVVQPAAPSSVLVNLTSVSNPVAVPPAGPPGQTFELVPQNDAGVKEW